MSEHYQITVSSWGVEESGAETLMALDTGHEPGGWGPLTAFGGTTAASGIVVNEATALTSAHLYQAITMLADDLAMAPVRVFRGDGRGNRDFVPNHRIAKLWNRETNPQVIPFSMRQNLMGWALMKGNGVGAVEFDSLGLAKYVWPLQPGEVYLQRVPLDRAFDDIRHHHLFVYRWNRSIDGASGFLFPNETFHVKLFGDPLWGYSPIQLMADTIGNGLAMTQFQGAAFANGARPSGVLQKTLFQKGIPDRLDREARKELRDAWNDMHAGVGNAHKIAILQDGMEFKPLSFTNHEAEMLDSLKFYREQVSAIWKIPIHKLGAMENSSVRSNLREQNLSYIQQCLLPYVTNWGQESLAKLTSRREREREELFIEFDFSHLTKADPKTHTDNVIAQRLNGLMRTDEARRELGFEPFGGAVGDLIVIPSNLANAETGEPLSQSPSGGGPAQQTQANDSDDDGAVDVEEAMLQFVRNQITRLQRYEVKGLHRMMDRRNGPAEFAEQLQEYYARFQLKLFEPLESLANVGNFDPLQINNAVMTYLTDSRRLVADCQSSAGLADATAGFPDRIEPFLEDLRPCPAH